MRVGLYPICGDVLHAGHMLAIEEAKQNCDYLVVALNCTPDGKTPVQSIYERFMQLRAVKWIDEIIPYQGAKDLELLALSFKYDIRFLGADYKNKEWDAKEIEEELGIKPYFLHRVHGLSSTELKQRISQASAIGSATHL